MSFPLLPVANSSTDSEGKLKSYSSVRRSSCSLPELSGSGHLKSPRPCEGAQRLLIQTNPRNINGPQKTNMPAGPGWTMVTDPSDPPAQPKEEQVVFFVVFFHKSVIYTPQKQPGQVQSATTAAIKMSVGSLTMTSSYVPARL